MSNCKILYLVRHAKSSWSDASLTDFDRPLNHRGLHDAPEMGQRMKKRNALPEIIVCSPAKRAVQTLELFDLGVEHIVFEGQIYNSSIGGMLDIIRALDDHYHSAMLVGHNPTMTQLAGWLSGVHIDNMPTCAIATLELSTQHWKNAGSYAAQLLDLDYPGKKG